ALKNYSVEKDIAAYIKKQMDSNYGIPWHVIVGRSFGSFVSHESQHFIYFYIGHVAFLIFKTT
ncbi:dynein light chain 1, cytoplasmic-like protein, partial [Nadsonia fulvescens var. elongata DSM 6958]